MDVSPKEGPAFGHTVLTITGLWFGTSPAARAFVGGVPCAKTEWQSQSVLKCTTPPGELTDLPVTVEYEGRVSNHTGRASATYFSYRSMVVDRIEPDHAPTQGGSIIDLHGQWFGQRDFHPLATVGGVKCVHTQWVSDTLVRCVVPPNYGVNHTIRVSAMGKANVNHDNHFFHYDPPAITSLSTDHGPTLGGTIVTIHGRNFGTPQADPWARVGRVPCMSTERVSHSELRCVVPAGVGRGHAIVVTVKEKRRTRSRKFRFTYDPPLVASVHPVNGPARGGYIMMIRGMDFGTGAATPEQTMWPDHRPIPAARVLPTIPDRVQVAFANCSTIPGYAGNCTIMNATELEANATRAWLLRQQQNATESDNSTTSDATNSTAGSPEEEEEPETPTEQTVKEVAVVDPDPMTSAAAASLATADDSTSGGQGATIGKALDTKAAAAAVARLLKLSGADSLKRGPSRASTPPPTVLMEVQRQRQRRQLAERVLRSAQNGDSSSTGTSSEGEGESEGEGGAASSVVKLTGPTDSRTAMDDATGRLKKDQGMFSHLTEAQLYTRVGPTQPVAAEEHPDPAIAHTIGPCGIGGVADYTPFGLRCVHAWVGGVPCMELEVVSNTVLHCLVPPNIRSNHSVEVMVGGQSSWSSTSRANRLTRLRALQAEEYAKKKKAINTTLSNDVEAETFPIVDFESFSYDPPLLRVWTPSHAPTAGGSTVNIRGVNFGVRDRVATTGKKGRLDLIHKLLVVRIAGRRCLRVVWFSDTMVECVVPPGIGANHSITVQVADQITNQTRGMFSYDAPRVLHIFPEHAPTHGHNQVVIRGRNFGAEWNQPWVQLGDWRAHNVTWISDTRVTCMTPEGHGANLSVVVGIADQSNAADNDLWTFDGPLVYRIIPNHCPAVGGCRVLVIGDNFGHEQHDAIFGRVNGRRCTNVTHLNHTHMEMYVPTGVGSGNNFAITVSDQTSPPNELFHYHIPEVWLTQPNHGVPMGGDVINITGVNFGTFDTTPVATLGDEPCANTTWVSDTRVVCIVPESFGWNKTATVKVAGQLSNVNKTSLHARFSYDPPQIQNISLVHGPAEGRSLLNITGINFYPGTKVYLTTMDIGRQAESADWAIKECRLSRRYSYRSVTCLTEDSVGANHSVQLSAAGRRFYQRTQLDAKDKAEIAAAMAAAKAAQSAAVAARQAKNAAARKAAAASWKIEKKSNFTLYTGPLPSAANSTPANASAAAPKASLKRRRRLLAASPLQPVLQQQESGQASFLQLQAGTASLRAGRVAAAGGSGRHQRRRQQSATSQHTLGPLSVARAKLHSEQAQAVADGFSGKASNLTAALAVPSESQTPIDAPAFEALVNESRDFNASGCVNRSSEARNETGAHAMRMDRAMKLLKTLGMGRGKLAAAAQKSAAAGGDAVKTAVSEAATAVVRTALNGSDAAIMTHALLRHPSNSSSNSSADAALTSSTLTAAANFSAGHNFTVTEVPAIPLEWPRSSAQFNATVARLATLMVNDSAWEHALAWQHSLVNSSSVDHNKPQCNTTPPVLDPPPLPRLIQPEPNITIPRTCEPPRFEDCRWEYDELFFARRRAARKLALQRSTGGSWMDVFDEESGEPLMTYADVLRPELGDTIADFTPLLKTGYNRDPRFSYDPPLIHRSEPQVVEGDTRGGFNITLWGRNFGTVDSKPTAYVDVVEGKDGRGFVPCLTTEWHSDRNLTCVVPAGVGTDRRVLVEVANQSSIPRRLLSYHAPVLQSVVPNHGHPRGGYDIMLIGRYFGTAEFPWAFRSDKAKAGHIHTGPARCSSTQWHNDTHITCTVNPAWNRDLDVRLGPLAGQSTVLARSFHYDIPIVTGVDPDHGPALGKTVVTVSGDNFGLAGMPLTCYINGIKCLHTIYVSPFELKCHTPPGVGPGKRVMVRLGAQVSVLNDFFTYDAPRIFHLSPTFGPAEGGNTIEAHGVNFGAYADANRRGDLHTTNSTMTVNRELCPVLTWVSDALIKCEVNPNIGVGRKPVTITVGDQTHAPAMCAVGAPQSDACHGVTYASNRPEVHNISAHWGPSNGGSYEKLPAAGGKRKWAWVPQVLEVRGRNYGCVDDPDGPIRVFIGGLLAEKWKRVSDGLLLVTLPQRKSVGSQDRRVVVEVALVNSSHDGLLANPRRYGPSPAEQDAGKAECKAQRRRLCTERDMVFAGKSTSALADITYCCDDSLFVFQPLIQRLGAPQGTEAGGSTLHIHGTNFGVMGSPLSVKVGDKPCVTSTRVSESEVVCESPWTMEDKQAQMNGAGGAYTAMSSQKPPIARYGSGSQLSSLAVDGVTNDETPAGVARTYSDRNAFLDIDLGKKKTVNTVTLFKHSATAAAQSPFYFLVSATPFPKSRGSLDAALQAATAHKHVFDTGAQVTWTPPAGTRGRYVRVQLEGTGQLAVRELEVSVPLPRPISMTVAHNIQSESPDLSRDDTGSQNDAARAYSTNAHFEFVSDGMENVARTSALRITASSEEPGWEAINAFNGRFRDGAGMAWSSVNQGVGAWLKIEFKRPMLVSALRILGRKTVRISGLEVLFSDGTKQSVSLPNNDKPNRADLTATITDFLQLTVTGVYGSGPVGVSEVQVRGKMTENTAAKDFQSCSASSQFADFYRCDNAFNGKLVDARGSAFAAKNEGDGAWIKVNFKGTATLHQLRYKQRANLAQGNSELRLDFSDGSTRTISPDRTTALAQYSFAPVTARSVKITTVHMYGPVATAPTIATFSDSFKSLHSRWDSSKMEPSYTTMFRRSAITFSGQAMNRAPMRTRRRLPRDLWRFQALVERGPTNANQFFMLSPNRAEWIMYKRRANVLVISYQGEQLVVYTRNQVLRQTCRPQGTHTLTVTNQYYTLTVKDDKCGTITRNLWNERMRGDPYVYIGANQPNRETPSRIASFELQPVPPLFSPLSHSLRTVQHDSRFSVPPVDHRRFVSDYRGSMWYRNSGQIRTRGTFPARLTQLQVTVPSDGCGNHYVLFSANPNARNAWGRQRDVVQVGYRCRQMYIYTPRGQTSRYCNTNPRHHRWEVKLHQDNTVEFRDPYCGSLRTTLSGFTTQPVYAFLGAEVWENRWMFMIDLAVFPLDSANTGLVVNRAITDDFSSMQHNLWYYQGFDSNNRYSYSAQGGLEFAGRSKGLHTLRTRASYVRRVRIDASITRQTSCDDHYIMASPKADDVFELGATVGLRFLWRCDRIYLHTPTARTSRSCTALGRHDLVIEITQSSVFFSTSKCGSMRLNVEPPDNLYLFLGADKKHTQFRPIFHSFKVSELPYKMQGSGATEVELWAVKDS